MGGFQGSVKFSGLAWYSASKAGLVGLTETLAEEYKATTVCFNCLALGAVQTEMLTEAFPEYRALVKPEGMAKYIAEFVLSGHYFFNGKTLPVALGNP
jgi:NAD(P)-dependent dehydrogenase (short-subunit alcohol dehydrogenase family)